MENISVSEYFYSSNGIILVANYSQLSCTQEKQFISVRAVYPTLRLDLCFLCCVTLVKLLVFSDPYSLSYCTMRINELICIKLGFPGGTNGKEPTCQCRRHKRCGFDRWVEKMPQRKAWQLTPVFCLENPMDRGAWKGMVHRVEKNQRNQTGMK